MISEIPITKKDDDVFERSFFANQIAEHLIIDSASPSMVLALEGQWGEGKTSTINLIKEKIQAIDETAAIIDFHPWLIGSLDSVIEGFLIQVASSINHTFNTDVATKAAGELLNFAKFLSPIKLIPGVEPWGTIVEKTLTAVSKSTSGAVDMKKLNLVGRKKGVQQAIDKLGKPIIIIIDDIDRLPPEEIRIIIQVVKAIADFKGVSYLLAYEVDPIIRSLEYNNTYDGRRYLEKIVQASYPLPRIGYWPLKTFLIKHITSLLEEIEIELTPQDRSILDEALDSTAIVRSLSTPRDIIRLVNRMRIIASNTKNEVNFSDVLAFETLELKYPVVSTAIRKTPEIFLNLSTLEGNSIIQDEIDQIILDDEHKNENSFQDTLRSENSLTEIDKKNISSILSFLFPGTFNEWDAPVYEDQVFNNRIATKEALLKLLQSGPTQFVFSSSEVKHFLTSETDRQQMLIDFLEAGNLSNWLQYASDFLSRSNIQNPESIWDELLKISLVAFVEEKYNLTNDVGSFVVHILENMDSESEKKSLLIKISQNEESLSLSENIILRLLLKAEMWRSGVYNGLKDEYSENELVSLPIHPKDLADAKEKWLNTLRCNANVNILQKEPEPISIFFRWGQLNNNDYSEAQECIQKLTSCDNGLKLLINCFYDGKGLTGIEKLFCNIEELIPEIEKLREECTYAGKFINYFTGLLKKEAN